MNLQWGYSSGRTYMIDFIVGYKIYVNVSKLREVL